MCRFPETGHKVHERSLSGPGGADERDVFARTNRQTDVSKTRFVEAGIREGNVVKNNCSLRSIEFDRTVVDFTFGVEHFKKTVRRRCDAGEGAVKAGQVLQRGLEEK